VAKLQQPDEEGSKLPAIDVAPAEMGASGAGRRRFAKAGMGASAGVIMTLASQPAMATTALCKSMSGAQSGNTSFHSDHLVPCDGVSPGYWKEHIEAWPSAWTNPDAKFSAVFTTKSTLCSGLSAYTCFQVCDPKAVANGADPDNVAMHVMATLLNVRSKRIGFLTESQVLLLWNSYARTGTYQPTVGVTWDGYKIVEYLKKTMS
jgi:hypothetical protein